MKKLYLVCIVLLAVSALVFASGAQEEAASSEAASPVFDLTFWDGGETIEIVYWYAVSGSKGEVFKELVDRFNESQDRIAVEGIFSGKYAETAEKVTAALASNTLPNGGVIPAGPIFTGQYDNYKILDYIENDPDFDMDDFYDATWDYSMYDGKICVIPYNISTPILYINEDLLLASGLDPADPPATWQELLDYSKKITKDVDNDGVNDVWGFDLKDTPWIFKAFLMQNGNDIIDTSNKNPLFTEASAIETAKFWKQLIDEEAMPAGLHNTAESLFLSGNLGFYIGSSSRIGSWRGKTEFKLNAAFLPKNERNAIPLGGAVMALFPSGDEDADRATYEFMKWMVSPEILAEFDLRTGYLPPRAAVLAEESVQTFLDEVPMYRVAYEQMEFASAYWHFNEMGTMDGLIWEALDKIDREVLTPEEGMQWLNKELIIEIEANK